MADFGLPDIPDWPHADLGGTGVDHPDLHGLDEGLDEEDVGSLLFTNSGSLDHDLLRETGATASSPPPHFSVHADVTPDLPLSFPPSVPGSLQHADLDLFSHPKDSHLLSGDLIPSDPQLYGRTGNSEEIKAITWAGRVVWAKLGNYPWWPAQVLSEKDPFIPNDADKPRRGAIPVRFFGTYEFAWIESQRQVAPLDKGYKERSAKSKAKPFLQSLQEALHYQSTGELPYGFELAMKTPGSKKGSGKKRKAPGTAGTASKGKGARADGQQQPGAGTPAAAGALSPVAFTEAERRQLALQRKQRVLQAMALVPPAGSPYATTLCIDPNVKHIQLSA